MANCVSCGSPIPDNQGSKVCSMCYGDPDHGKDGYYQDWLERQYEQEQNESENS
jgi:hypothetical protein